MFVGGGGGDKGKGGEGGRNISRNAKCFPPFSVPPPPLSKPTYGPLRRRRRRRRRWFHSVPLHPPPPPPAFGIARWCDSGEGLVEVELQGQLSTYFSNPPLSPPHAYKKVPLFPAISDFPPFSKSSRIFSGPRIFSRLTSPSGLVVSFFRQTIGARIYSSPFLPFLLLLLLLAPPIRSFFCGIVQWEEGGRPQ